MVQTSHASGNFFVSFVSFISTSDNKLVRSCVESSLVATSMHLSSFSMEFVFSFFIIGVPVVHSSSFLLIPLCGLLMVYSDGTIQTTVVVPKYFFAHNRFSYGSILSIVLLVDNLNGMSCFNRFYRKNMCDMQ